MAINIRRRVAFRPFWRLASIKGKTALQHAGLFLLGPLFLFSSFCSCDCSCVVSVYFPVACLFPLFCFSLPFLSFFFLTVSLFSVLCLCFLLFLLRIVVFFCVLFLVWTCWFRWKEGILTDVVGPVLGISPKAILSRSKTPKLKTNNGYANTFHSAIPGAQRRKFGVPNTETLLTFPPGGKQKIKTKPWARKRLTQHVLRKPLITEAPATQHNPAICVCKKI